MSAKEGERALCLSVCLSAMYVTVTADGSNVNGGRSGDACLFRLLLLPLAIKYLRPAALSSSRRPVAVVAARLDIEKAGDPKLPLRKSIAPSSPPSLPPSFVLAHTCVVHQSETVDELLVARRSEEQAVSRSTQIQCSRYPRAEWPTTPCSRFSVSKIGKKTQKPPERLSVRPMNNP